MTVDQAAVAAWVLATCQRQGVPVKVSDPAALARVGVLLTGQAGGTRAQGAKAPRTRPPARPSQPPLGVDAGLVQAVPPGDGSGKDRGVVQDGLDDGDLTGQVQPVPLGS